MRVILTLCLIFMASLTYAAPSKSDVSEFLARLYTAPALRAELQSYGFEGANLELAIGHVQRVMNDRVIAGKIADHIIAAGQGRLEVGNTDGFIAPLVSSGLPRLSTRELSYYYKVEATVFGALPKRECGLALKGKLSPKAMTRVTARTAAKLNTAALKEYYRISFKAARLGATKPALVLSGRDAAQRAKKLVSVLEAEAATRSNGAALMRAYETNFQVSNNIACEAGLLLFDAVLKQPPRARHELLVFMGLN